MKLFPYQQDGVDWLAGLRHALLADTMGLGKTAQAIVAAAKTAGADGWPCVLVVCPASVVENWKREFGLWWPVGQTKPALKVVSYDRLTRHLAEYQTAWHAVILDEAHYLKNPKAKRTKAVFGPKMGGKGGVIERAERVWCLTGTPAPNNPSELWPMLYSLNPGALIPKGKYDYKPLDFYRFTRRYCVVKNNGFGEVIVRGQRLGELRERMAPFVLRRLKDQVLKDLPELRFGDLVLDGKDAAKALAALDHDDVKRVQKALETGGAEALSKLSTEMATVRRLTALAKAPLLAEWLKEWLDAFYAGRNSEREAGSARLGERYAEGPRKKPSEQTFGKEGKIVIFAQHREAIEALEQALAGYAPAVVHGGVAQAGRQAAVDKFQSVEACRVFIGQIQAAGTGITLTAASDLIFLEQSWTPSDNAQAAMRIHRIGQKRGCLVRTAMLAGSIDEAVQRTLARKTEDLVALFDAVA